MQFLKRHRISLIIFIILAGINFLAYGFNLNDFFVSDDFDWLKLTRDETRNVGEIFLTNNYGEAGLGGNFRPMVNLAFLVNYKIWGLNPLGYHLFSLLLHIGVCFLIYLLVARLMASKNPNQSQIAENINLIAILASIFFAILPNHSEAVIWVAAVGDVLAVFFYLLSFYLYLVFRDSQPEPGLLASLKQKYSYLAISLVAFMLALFSKEIAITLPFLIILYELYQAISCEFTNQSRIAEFFKKIKFFIWYFVGLIIFFLLRLKATGLVLGYYATDKVKISITAIYKMFLALFFDNFSYGKYRVILTEYFYQHYALTGLIILTLLTLLMVLTYLKIKAQSSKPKAQNYWYLFLIDSYILLCLPVLLLIFNPNNDEGERYSYLPSVVFCIMLALILGELFSWLQKLEIRNWKLGKYFIIVDGLLLIVIAGYFGYWLNYKNQNWHLAGEISNKIITDLKSATNSAENVNALTLALPDNFEGAHLMRNGFKQAISLYQPAVKLDAILLPVYLQLNRQNYNQQILNWEVQPDGYYAQCADGSYCVTGFDRRESADVTFELWGYNYANYTSNQIKLIFKQQFIDSMAQKKIYILVYYDGLKELK